MLSSNQSVFSDIHKSNAWGSTESVSGRGSEFANTAQLIRELPLLLHDLHVRTMLDAPCGDFNWMQHVDLGNICYHGVDVVPDVVQRNVARYARDVRTFSQLDILQDAIPSVDLILCRDCLFHFSHVDVFRALRAFADSGSTWLLTTTQIYRGLPRNGNIVTGQWTPINLELPPYNLPPPRRLLLEGNVTELITYTQPDGSTLEFPQNDRCLGLWLLADARECLARAGG